MHKYTTQNVKTQIKKNTNTQIKKYKIHKKSRNSDTLGPVELNVRLEQSNQGDR